MYGFQTAANLSLQLLDLHLPRQLQRNVVNHLVVHPGPLRGDADAAEDLVVNVPVQLLHQSWGTQLRVPLQEHQLHFPLRCEVTLPTSLRHQALTHKTKRLGHLSQRKELLHSLQFCTFKRQFVKLEKKSNSVNGILWLISAKFCTFVIVH